MLLIREIFLEYRDEIPLQTKDVSVNNRAQSQSQVIMIIIERTHKSTNSKSQRNRSKKQGQLINVNAIIWCIMVLSSTLGIDRETTDTF